MTVMTVINNPGRGNCFFYAVAIGMHDHITNGGRMTTSELRQTATDLRLQVVDKMRSRVEDNYNFRQAVVGAEVNHRVRLGYANEPNVSVMTHRYLSRMGSGGTWGGHPEMNTTHVMLQDMGWKGLGVYQENENRTFTKLTNYTGNLNHSKPMPEVRILILGVQRGGTHYQTIVPPSVR